MLQALQRLHAERLCVALETVEHWSQTVVNAHEQVVHATQICAKSAPAIKRRNIPDNLPYNNHNNTIKTILMIIKLVDKDNGKARTLLLVVSEHGLALALQRLLVPLDQHL